MSNRPIEEYLSKQKFFSGLSPEVIGFLAGCATQREVESGQVLFPLGERANRFYLICTGSICVEIPAISGPSLTVQSLGPDQVLGWSWLIPPYKWNFQARAQVQSKLFEFDGEKVLACCERDSEFGYELLKRFASLMSERLEAARQSMMGQWNPPGFA